ncbi:helix-turn-helix transcriptional regulator [Actinoallomurus sp. NPDC052274]|uniref:helix-turn-helix domain-containing protein n=1 Tax=Actinoallomurus sp. NPDC052274 TaxID=3155420 RepID=UPI003430D5B7
MAPKRETALDAWGRELAYACEAADLTGKQLAERLHVVPSTVSQWMNGRRTPHLEDVERCDQVLGTNGYLVRYFKQWVTPEVPSVWADQWRMAEAHANMIQSYDASAIPGILQTPEYARAVIGLNRHSPIDLDERVHRRIERQAILNDQNPPMCIFVIDEYALYRMFGGPKVMIDQLVRLLDYATWPNILIKIIPEGTEYYAGSSFMILRLDDANVVNLDDALNGRIIDGRGEIAEVNKIWEEIREVALPCNQSVELIEKAIKKWES